MSTKTFFPYATIDDLRVDIATLKLDGLEHSVSKERVIKLESEDWRTLEAEFLLQAPSGFESAFPPNERVAPPARLAIGVNCPETRTYSIAHAEGPVARSGSVKVALERQNLRGVVEIAPYVLRTTRRSGGDGWAFEEGAIVARGEPLAITVDHEESLIGGLLKGVWENFETSTAFPELRSVARATHYVSLTDPPVLYLNSAVTGLQSLLSSKKAAGVEAGLRDVVFDSISGSAWLTLVLGAASTAIKNEGDRFVAANVWSERVLEYIAPRMTGAPDVQDAIDGFVGQLRDDNAVGAMLSRIEAHFQQRDDFGTHLDRLFAAMRKEA